MGGGGSFPNISTTNLSPRRIICLPKFHLSPSQHTDASYLNPTPRCLFSPPPNPPLLLSRLTDSCRRLTLAATKIASTVTLRWSSAAFYLHHVTWSLPPSPYPVSRAHTSKIGRVATHYATVACLLSTYVLSVCVPAPCRNAYAVTCLQDPYLLRIAFLRVTCLNKITYAPSNRYIIVSVITHLSLPNLNPWSASWITILLYKPDN